MPEDKTFNKYSEYYDLLYQDKDYNSECDFVEAAFHRYADRKIRTVLDAGCGSGGHALSFNRRGYSIVGIDKSETMIQRARQRANDNQQKIDFSVADITTLDLGMKFDACVSMFSVIGYITKNKDVTNAFTNIRKHLNKGSLFIFDCWNGLAVMRTLPTTRLKTVASGDVRVLRFAEPVLDAANHLCRINYRLFITKGNKIESEIIEEHEVRFFFPQEIAYYLEDTGFQVLKICPFPKIEGKVDENEWNLAVIARAGNGGSRDSSL